MTADHILNVGPMTLNDQSGAVTRLWRTGGGNDAH